MFPSDVCASPAQCQVFYKLEPIEIQSQSLVPDALVPGGPGSGDMEDCQPTDFHPRIWVTAAA